MKSTIGDRIRVLRQIKGLSQENMANELNISVAAYSNIERNVTELAVSRLILIAKILEVKTSDILEKDKSQIVSEFDSANKYQTKNQSDIQSEVDKLKVIIDTLRKEMDVLKQKSQTKNKKSR